MNCGSTKEGILVQNDRCLIAYGLLVIRKLTVWPIPSSSQSSRGADEATGMHQHLFDVVGNLRVGISARRNKIVECAYCFPARMTHVFWNRSGSRFRLVDRWQRSRTVPVAPSFSLVHDLPPRHVYLSVKRDVPVSCCINLSPFKLTRVPVTVGSNRPSMADFLRPAHIRDRVPPLVGSWLRRNQAKFRTFSAHFSCDLPFCYLLVAADFVLGRMFFPDDFLSHNDFPGN